jgi:MFS family permease
MPSGDGPPAGAAPAPASLRRRLLADVTPLKKFPQFRILWSGYLVSVLGSQLTVVAVPYQVFRITHSSLDVGLLSLAQLGPLLVGSLVGGAVVDAVDRRRLLLVTELVLGGSSVGLGLDSVGGHPALWPLFVLTALAAAFSAVDSSARSAMLATIVGPESYAASSALWQLLFQVGQVAGPAIAGLLLTKFAVSVIYFADAGSFGIAFISVVMLGHVPRPAGRTTFSPRSIADGFRFLKGRQALQATFVVDLDAMIFGMPRAVFPALGLNVFHGGAQAVGYLYSAPGAGALIGALTTGWVGRVERQGRAVVVSVAIWGAAIAGFGLCPLLAPALVLLAIAGAADVISAVFRNTILQTTVPDALRGRLSAIHIGVVTGGPRLGDTETGAVAALAGARVAVVSGGLACLGGLAVTAWRMPALMRYDRAAAVEAAAAAAAEVAAEAAAAGPAVSPSDPS